MQICSKSNSWNEKKNDLVKPLLVFGSKLKLSFFNYVIHIYTWKKLQSPGRYIYLGPTNLPLSEPKIGLSKDFQARCSSKSSKRRVPHFNFDKQRPPVTSTKNDFQVNKLEKKDKIRSSCRIVLHGLQTGISLKNYPRIFFRDLSNS